jgi:hypothetical protein
MVQQRMRSYGATKDACVLAHCANGNELAAGREHGLEFVSHLNVLIHQHLHALDGVFRGELDVFHVRLHFEK